MQRQVMFPSKRYDSDVVCLFSIPHSMWWAVITLCTIGYGDLVPTSAFGQLCGGMACVSGVVMVALPISVISSTFQKKYQEHMDRQAAADTK